MRAPSTVSRHSDAETKIWGGGGGEGGSSPVQDRNFCVNPFRSPGRADCALCVLFQLRWRVRALVYKTLLGLSHKNRAWRG